MAVYNPLIPSIVLGLFLIASIGVGLFAYRYIPEMNMEEYIAGGRNIGWFVALFSLTASMFSALTFMGFPAFYALIGVSALIPIFAAGILIHVAWIQLCAPRVWKLGRAFGQVTPSDIVSDYFESPVLGYITGIVLIISLIPYLQAQITGLALLTEIITEDLIPFWQAGGLVVGIIIVYTWAGGLKSVAWVDTFHGVLLFTGLLGGGLYLYFAAGGPSVITPTVIEINAPAFRTPNAPFTWVYIITFVLVLFGWQIQHHMHQRFHYFKSPKFITYVAGLYALVFALCTIGGYYGGLAGFVEFGDTDIPADGYWLMAARLYLPVGIFAIIGAAGFAAMMSSASSQALGIGTVVSQDITRKMWSNREDIFHVWVARITFSIATIIAYLLAVLRTEYILVSGVAAASVAISALFMPMLVALFAKSWASKRAALASATVGPAVVIGILVFIGDAPMGVYGGFWGLLAHIGTFLVASAIDPKSINQDKVEAYTKVIYQKSMLDLQDEYIERQKMDDN